MCSLIGLGHWTPYYYYILITDLVKFLKEDILGIGVENQIIVKLKVVFHPIIILLIGYISDFLLSILLWWFFNYRERKKEEMKNSLSLENEDKLSRANTPDKFFELKEGINGKENIIDDDFRKSSTIKTENTMKYYLIHNDLTSEYDSISNYSTMIIIISSCFITIKECINRILYSSNDIFDYYFLNLIIIAIIFRCFYKKKIYKHHKFSIILVSIISGSCLISCIIISSNDNYEGNHTSFLFTYKDRIHIIFILIAIYLIVSICFCTGIIFQKNLMQSKFISSYKLLFYKGIFGIAFTTIALIITTNVPCENNDYTIRPFGPPPEGGKPDGPPPDGAPPGPPPELNDTNITEHTFQLYICRDHYLNETYFDNIYSYFNNNDTIYPNNTLGEVLILIAYFFLNFISNLSIILVNKFLTPFHYLITESFYSLIHIPYQYFTRDSMDELIKKLENDYNEVTQDKLYQLFFQKDGLMFLKFAAAFFEFLGYMIYLEIIQLNFCGLNRDLSKNIKKRAKLDAILSEQDLNDENDINPVNESIEVTNRSF